MGHISMSCIVEAPVGDAFNYAMDFERASDWLVGLNDVEVLSEQTRGLGTRLRGSLKIGPTKLGATVEVVGWEEGTKVVARSVDGIDLTFTWMFDAASDDTTTMSSELDYTLPGGLAGRAIAKAAEPAFKLVLQKNEANLKSNIEKNVTR